MGGLGICNFSATLRIACKASRSAKRRARLHEQPSGTGGCRPALRLFGLFVHLTFCCSHGRGAPLHAPQPPLTRLQRHASTARSRPLQIISESAADDCTGVGPPPRPQAARRNGRCAHGPPSGPPAGSQQLAGCQQAADSRGGATGRCWSPGATGAPPSPSHHRPQHVSNMRRPAGSRQAVGAGGGQRRHVARPCRWAAQAVGAPRR